MNFPVNDLFSKREQIHSFQRSFSHYLNKSLTTKKFIFRGVKISFQQQLQLHYIFEYAWKLMSFTVNK